jgi:hypothetical protein
MARSKPNPFAIGKPSSSPFLPAESKPNPFAIGKPSSSPFLPAESKSQLLDVAGAKPVMLDQLYSLLLEMLETRSVITRAYCNEFVEEYNACHEEKKLHPIPSFCDRDVYYVRGDTSQVKDPILLYETQSGKRIRSDPARQVGKITMTTRQPLNIKSGNIITTTNIAMMIVMKDMIHHIVRTKALMLRNEKSCFPLTVVLDPFNLDHYPRLKFTAAIYLGQQINKHNIFALF